MTKWREMVLMA